MTERMLSAEDVSWQLRITELLESIGLPAPQPGEPGNEACAKLVGGIEKLIAVAKAAKAATEDWYSDDSYKECRRALGALEFKC